MDAKPIYKNVESEMNHQRNYFKIHNKRSSLRIILKTMIFKIIRSSEQQIFAPKTYAHINLNQEVKQ
jgi:hypothetical protein